MAREVIPPDKMCRSEGTSFPSRQEKSGRCIVRVAREASWFPARDSIVVEPRCTFYLAAAHNLSSVQNESGKYQRSIKIQNTSTTSKNAYFPTSRSKYAGTNQPPPGHKYRSVQVLNRNGDIAHVAVPRLNPDLKRVFETEHVSWFESIADTPNLHQRLMASLGPTYSCTTVTKLRPNRL